MVELPSSVSVLALGGILVVVCEFLWPKSGDGIDDVLHLLVGMFTSFARKFAMPSPAAYECLG